MTDAKKKSAGDKRPERRKKTRRKKLRVLVLMHEDLVPPEDVSDLSESEFHRIKT